MKNAYTMLIVALLVVSFAGSSYGGTEQLMNLVQSKEFWSTYKWGRTVNESKLFKSAKWKLRKTDKDDQNYYYDTDITLASKPTQMTISINKGSNKISDYQVTLEDITYSDYTELLNWSEKQYGKPDIYNEHKIRAGEGIFIPYIVKRSSWIAGNSVINLAVTADLALKPLVVDLIVSDKRSVKLDKPSIILICRNMTMSSTPDQQLQVKKMNDVTMILDENTNKVFDANLDPTGLSFTVTDKYYKIERKSEIGSLVYNINLSNGKLDGRIISYDVPSIVSGECEKKK